MKEVILTLPVLATEDDAGTPPALLPWTERGSTSIAQQDGEGKTALHLACSNGHVGLVSWVIAQGAPVEARGDDGRSASWLWAWAYPPLQEVLAGYLPSRVRVEYSLAPEPP